jgi:hypothetical protein
LSHRYCSSSKCFTIHTEYFIVVQH